MNAHLACSHRLGLVGSIRPSKPSLSFIKPRMGLTRRERASVVRPSAILSWLGRGGSTAVIQTAIAPQESWVRIQPYFISF